MAIFHLRPIFRLIFEVHFSALRSNSDFCTTVGNAVSSHLSTCHLVVVVIAAPQDMPKTTVEKPRTSTSGPVASKPRTRKTTDSLKAASAADTDDSASAAGGGRLVIKWDNGRTDRLLDWLDHRPEDRHRLFSDSTVTAKSEGRKKVVAKGSKTRFHEAIAKEVFNHPEDDLRVRYQKEPGKFANSVCNYLSRCVIRYRIFLLL